MGVRGHCAWIVYFLGLRLDVPKPGPGEDSKVPEARSSWNVEAHDMDCMVDKRNLSDVD
jgi:hypothetical protein